MNKDTACGLSFWHPKWLQRFANSKVFLVVYGLLGTVQAMAYLYFVVTLTTIEKRFKIPSQTTGIILSGNEISQILLSLILTYYGGNRNRPRWISWGVIFCALSCFVLASPHFIYGPGEEALKLTKEYLNDRNGFTISNRTVSNELCMATDTTTNDCTELITFIPLLLIFLSQFILGIGNTLYYSLGQTYLDDNTKKTQTPMMLAYAFSLRMLGPVIGFSLGAFSLNIYIDPTKTPVIASTDPRWMGAWWLGWMILGTVMMIFSFLISLFPKYMPKTVQQQANNAILANSVEEEILNPMQKIPIEETITKMKYSNDGFRVTLMRLLKNKLLMYNSVSGIFYVLGATGFMTFMTRYIEVQFRRGPREGVSISGPITIFGMVLGFFISGYVLSKKRPKTSKVLFWNVVGAWFLIASQIAYMFLACEHNPFTSVGSTFNLSASCNSHCDCNGVTYNPVHDDKTCTTFYSPCHAGCTHRTQNSSFYYNCNCVTSVNTIAPTIPDFKLPETTVGVPKIPEILLTESTSAPPMALIDSIDKLMENTNEFGSQILTVGSCAEGCQFYFIMFTVISLIVNFFGSTGRIGNVLLNYRVVEPRDKSFSQGLLLMLMSLFALIPGPILFGRVIDQTCLVWGSKCGRQGNCQLYDQTLFRYYVNGLSVLFSVVGMIFDFLVWKNGKNVDLYNDLEVPNENNGKEMQPLKT